MRTIRAEGGGQRGLRIDVDHRDGLASFERDHGQRDRVIVLPTRSSRYVLVITTIRTTLHTRTSVIPSSDVQT